MASSLWGSIVWWWGDWEILVRILGVGLVSLGYPAPRFIFIFYFARIV